MSYGFVVLSFNHPHITSSCLDSLLVRVSPDKILLCHNGTLLPHQELLKSRYPDIHHQVLNENKGYTGGVNACFELGFKTWDWIYFLTNDTTLLSYSNLPEEPGLYAPLIWRRKIGVMDSIGGVFTPSTQNLYHLKSVEAWNNLTPLERLYVPGTAFLIHRDIFLKVGLFDETLHTYWEDVDFSQRVQQNKLPIKPHPSFELLHKVGKTCHKDPFYTKELFHRNKEIVSKRYV